MPDTNISPASNEINDIQLNHALLDCDLFSKPKMKLLRIKFGQLAKLWFVEVILDMSRATDGAIDECLVLELAREVGIEKPDELVWFALAQGILTKLPNNKITNRRVQEDREKLHKRRDGDAERQRRYRDRHRDKVRDVTVFPDTDTVTDTGSVLDLKKEESSREGNIRAAAVLKPPVVPKKPTEPDKPPVGYVKKGKHCYISEIDLDQFRVTKGDEFLERCFELINAWVEESAGTHDFHDRSRRAKNCSALFQNWVFIRVQQERDKADKAAKPRKTFQELEEERLKRIGDEALDRFVKTVRA